jgi:flagellar biosynthesis protein FliQ
MTENLIVYLGKEAFYTVILVSAPILVSSLVIGLIVSIFQATTQIQDQTLSFVPKILAVIVSIVFFGPWMMNILLSFASNLLVNLHTYTFIR